MNENAYVYNGEENSELKPEGDYEVFIEKMEVRVLRTGTEKLFIQYRVRSDVEQQYKNACLFEDIWKEKNNPNKFNGVRINQLLGTQHPEKGTVFNGINDVINFMLGKKLIVHLVQQFDNYQNATINVVKYYKSSNAKPRTLGETSVSPTPTISPADDDLPF